MPRWSTDEEDRLRALVKEHGDRAWPRVAELLQTGRHHIGCGRAVGIDDQTAEITAVTIPERPQMGVCLIRVPVSLGSKTCNRHPFRVDGRLTGMA